MKVNHQQLIPPLLFLGACIATLVVYWPGLSGPFLLDDANSVQYHLLNEWDYDAFIESVFRNSSGPTGRPIPIATFIFSGLLHGNSEWGFKYHNLLIHLLIGLAAYVLIFKLSLVAQYNESKGHLIAALCATLWLLHPLHVSTTLYAVQRMAQLSCLFVLCALIAYTHGRVSHNLKTKLVCYLLLVPVLGIAGMFSKENTALLPLFILVLEIFFRPHLNTEKSDNYAVLIFSIIPIILGIVGLALFHERVLDYSGRLFSLTDRLLTQIDVITLYLKQVTLPRLADMGLFLDDQVIRTSIDAIGMAKLAGLIFAFSVGLYLLTKGSLIGLGISFFFVGHALESSFIPLEIIFEHRNYLPSIGLMLAIVVTATNIPIANPIRIVLGSIYILLFAGMLFGRAGSWTSGESMLLNSLRDHPNSVRTKITLADYYIAHNLIDEGVAQIRAARILQPEEPGFTVIEILVHCGSESIPINLYENSLQAYSDSPLSVYGLTNLNILVSQKYKKTCPALSIEQMDALLQGTLTRALALSPDRPINQYIYLLMARLMLVKGTNQEAITYVEEAFNHQRNPAILFEMLDMLFATGKIDAASDLLIQIEEGQLINPNRSQPQIKLFKTILEEERAKQNDRELLDSNTS